MANQDELLGVRTVPGEAASFDGIATSVIGILDAVDLPIVVIDRDCRVARLNRASTTVLGLMVSDIGRPLASILAGGFRNLDTLCAQVIVDGAPCRREIREGDRFFLLRIAPYTGSDRQVLGAVLTFTNVTPFRARIDQAIYEREYTKAILNTVIDPLVVLDAQLRVHTANRAFYSLFGVSLAEAQSVSIRKLGNNDWESSEVWASIETTLSEHTEFHSAEIEREFPAIGRRTVVLDARRLARDGDALILLTIQDVTERKQAERTTSLLAAIVDYSDDCIVSKNLDGIITSWNAGAERMFGYKADEAIGRHITLIIPPDRQDEEQEILRRMRNGERVDHFETVRARKDGTVLNIAATISPIKDAAGHVIGASKVARDITERLQAERALVEQARLLDLTNDAILVRDSDDRITYWNKGASELYGFSRDEALGRVSHELLRTAFPEPIESIREELNRENRWTGEVIHNCKEGSQITVLSRWVLDRDQYGSPQGVLETNNDITEQKRAEEALRQSEEVLRALSQSLEFQIQARTTELEQRNEEVLQRSEQLRRLWNRLVRTQEEERRHIARELHDSLGQYLAALSMVLESAKQETPASQKLKEAVQIVQTCIMDVRTVSHLLHPPLLEEAGLASAAKWYIEGFAQRSGILAGVEIDETVGRLPEDIELGLFRVLQESLTNVHRHSGSKTVAVRIGADAQQVWLDIQDQGKGMPGLGRPGVGITSMRERVENLAGEFLVTSDQNGTRVRVVLPLASASRSSAAAS